MEITPCDAALVAVVAYVNLGKELDDATFASIGFCVITNQRHKFC
ncbi:uncharacterized protein METZ01_LOCUS429954 [marine metagenome]|uniref:Uncharacterized protein n=1 Tax=marine metagenome TaxID=408172 RepID=A0A382Y1T4_9ZZZZ